MEMVPTKNSIRKCRWQSNLKMGVKSTYKLEWKFMKIKDLTEKNGL